ncbi:MAG: magnesium/cobalt transporter CorA [candidate division Zixibacteria bacterium]|nr:magnesium/cobalt transporter CorA [candidate division Zixibacteria bacterium]
MNRFSKQGSEKVGLKPGEIVYVGRERDAKTFIKVMDYDATNLREIELTSIEDCFAYRDTESVSWIDINGIHEVDVIEKLGSHFDIHPLILEDIVNTNQRPKMEESDGIIFVVLKMLHSEEKTTTLSSEQVSILFGKNLVITLQEQEGDVFDYIRERIRKTIPRVRFLGSDYLAYAIVDAIVDHYFLVLENLGEQIESLEDRLINQPEKSDLDIIHALKRELLFMRKSVWPLRELVAGLERSESDLIHDYTRPYIRDLYEHIIQVIDSIETFRDMVSGLLDLYLTSVSNRMNEVMKVLTIIATIFIPLGFLAGVYGMNFNTSISPWNLPELDFRFGYPLFWTIVLLVAGGLFWLFKRKKWL